MKILCLTPENPNIKTPETTFAETLAKNNDVILELTRFENPILLNQEVLDTKPDVVFGMMESSLPIAYAYAKTLGVPLYAHMEWVPPWRVGLENPIDWGFDERTYDELDPNYIGTLKRKYTTETDYFYKADYKTIPGETLKYTFEEFTGKPLTNYEVRPYTIDFKTLQKHLQPTIKKNQICCIARLVPHKRVHHIIRAVAKLENKPKVVIVGYGPERDLITILAKNLNVEVQFVGSGQDGIKEKVLQESKLLVSIWAGLPTAEAFFYGIPVVAYKESHLHEIYGDDCVVWAERNNIDDLATKIKLMLENEELRSTTGQKSRQYLMNNKFKLIVTQDKFVEQVENILKRLVK